MLELRDRSMARHHVKHGSTLEEHTLQPRGLIVGESISIQNRDGNHKFRWDKTGIVVVEAGSHHDYTIRVD